MRLEMVALSQISRAPCVPKWQVCTIGVATATQLASGRVSRALFRPHNTSRSTCRHLYDVVGRQVGARHL